MFRPNQNHHLYILILYEASREPLDPTETPPRGHPAAATGATATGATARAGALGPLGPAEGGAPFFGPTGGLTEEVGGEAWEHS